MILDDFQFKLNKKYFQIAIFGSIIKDNPIYNEMYQLQKLIAMDNINVIIGDHRGIMKSVSHFHQDGKINNDCNIFGINSSYIFNDKVFYFCEDRRYAP